MGHDHDHRHHHHHHHHADETNQRRVMWVLILTAIFMFVEFAFGVLANSLALIADSFHMLADVAALSLTLVAFHLGKRPATERNTFGFYRMEILAAFINGVFLGVIALAIIWQAFERFSQPPEVDASRVIVVAVLGLALNLAAGFILMKGDKDNLNLRGALFHVMGDALASVGTIISSLLIMWMGWMLADPIVSAIIAVIIIFSAYRLISDTVHVILQGVPLHVDVKEIKSELLKLEGVGDIHNLHVWGLSSKMVILTVHVVESGKRAPGLLENVKSLLKEKFHIDHTTIQIEEKSLEAHEPRF